MHIHKKHFLKYAGLILLISIFILFLFYTYKQQTNHDNQINVATVVAALKNDPATYDFSRVHLTAKAAYVYDITNKRVLFDKNGQTQLPLASVEKVALMLLAERILPKNALIPISVQAIKTEGDSGLVVGDSWYKQPLISFTLMMSSNDGATAIGEALTKKTGVPIVALLNSFARSLGLQQTYFVNDTGLDSNNFLSGVYSSAQNVAKLFTYAFKTDASAFISTTHPAKRYYDSKGNEYLGINTNTVIRSLPGLVFGKTGFTDLAGGNIAVVFEPEPGHAFVVVILGSTEQGRFKDLLTLVSTILHTTPNKGSSA